MAQLQAQSRFRHQNIQIFKTDCLGHGAYGAVYRAKCDVLPCAAKIIHPTIFDQLDPNAGKMLEQFERECELLNQIKHPNVVQYLGTSCDAVTGLPVLLMEIMQESLTAFLERVQKPVPLHIQVDIYCDIALALAYLHSIGILHRDLSGKNVLLSPCHQAKVTDFGMSKLLNTSSLSDSLTFCPGTHVYMPPEALREPAVYSDKLDCFSSGVIAVQLMTRLFPDPGPRVEIVEDQNYPTGMVEVPIPELQRRKSHIDLVDAAHPLLSIACECLKDKDTERPSSQALCARLAGLKDHPMYRQSMQKVRSPESQIQELQQQLQQRDKELELLREQLQTREEESQAQLETHQQEIQSAEERLVQVEGELQANEELMKVQTQELSFELEQKEKQLQSVKKERLELSVSINHLQKDLSATKKMNERLERDLASKEVELQQLKLHGTNGVAKKGVLKSVQMTWRRESDAPFSGKLGSAAVLGTLVCIRMAGSSEIHICDATNGEWFQAPTCPLDACSLVAVKNTLTVAGGRIGASVTNLLYSLHMRSLRAYKKQPWKEQFPAMPTKRMFAMAVSSANVLVVVGGWSGHHPVHAVEVLRLDNFPHMWMRAASLPSPVYSASACICKGKLYVLGGFTQKGPTKAVACATVHSLLDSHKEGVVWHRATSLPTYRSTCITINDRLLSLGGENESSAEQSVETGSVFEFNTVEQEWDMVSQMPTPRCQSCAATLPDRKEIMVVGGHSAASGRTDTVEVASLEL